MTRIFHGIYPETKSVSSAYMFIRSYFSRVLSLFTDSARIIIPARHEAQFALEMKPPEGSYQQQQYERNEGCIDCLYTHSAHEKHDEKENNIHNLPHVHNFQRFSEPDKNT